jgi:hypothetical protein
MLPDTDYFPELTRLVRQALDAHLRTTNPGFLSMLTDDIVFEFPFALPEGLTHLNGKAALAEHLKLISSLISLESMTLENTLIDTQAEQAMLEMSCRGTSNVTGNRYDQHYVCVLTLREGLISRWRDYWDPIVVVQAMGGSVTIPEQMKGQKS